MGALAAAHVLRCWEIARVEPHLTIGWKGASGSPLLGGPLQRYQASYKRPVSLRTYCIYVWAIHQSTRPMYID